MVPQGVRSPAAVSKLAALLTLWADPSDGAWHHVVSCQQAGAGEGGTSAEAPTHLAYLWRDRVSIVCRCCAAECMVRMAVCTS